MALPPGELEALQAAILDTLPLVAAIERNTSAIVTLGQKTETWTTIASSVKCGMRQPSQAIAAQYASLIGAQQATVFSFPEGQDVQRNDRIVVSGTTWTVQAPLTPQSYSVSTQVLATRII